MLVHLLVFLFFAIFGVQLLRGKCQWLVPGQEEEAEGGKLSRKGAVKSRRSRAVGILLLFCGVCVLVTGIGTLLQQPWVGRLVSALMIVIVIVGVIFIASSNKLRR